LIQEIRSLFPEAPEVLVLSIGTGLGDLVEIKDSLVAILSALKKMASKILGHTLNYVNDQKSELARCAKVFSAAIFPELPAGTDDRKEVSGCAASGPEKSELDAQDEQYELMART
jgi:hypothetical protein